MEKYCRLFTKILVLQSTRFCNKTAVSYRVGCTVQQTKTSLSLSLSLSHTHTHTHTHFQRTLSTWQPISGRTSSHVHSLRAYQGYFARSVRPILTSFSTADVHKDLPSNRVFRENHGGKAMLYLRAQIII
jgi:hypothetical protein